MIYIEKINDIYRDKTLSFLKSVPSIENVDGSIVDNAVIAVEDDKIVGCISFEEFDKKALVRYFVFKKMLANSYLELLLSKLEEKVVSKKINMLVCIAENSQIEDLFNSLGFIEVNNKKIFINEEDIKYTNFKNSIFLNKLLTD